MIRTGTNIITSRKKGKDNDALSHYCYTKYPLRMKLRVSSHNMIVLMQRDARAFMLFQRLMFELKENPKGTVIDTISVSISKQELYTLFGRNSLKPLMDLLVSWNFVKRDSDSQRNTTYYINPNVANVLTYSQSNKYVEEYVDFFQPLD